MLPAALLAAAMTLLVDESQAPRRIAYVHERMPASPGTLDLAYPKWIPGSHGPLGPIQQMAALRVRAAGRDLAWRRDPDDLYTLHVTVPAGVDAVDVDFDTLIENTIDDRQLLLAWNTTVLYPRTASKDTLMVTPSVILPPTWHAGSALHVTAQTGDRIDFAPLTLDRLIDSPVIAGAYYRSVPLTSQWPAELDITGSGNEALDDADKAHAFTLFAHLLDQDRAMFGFRHWDRMHILITQSAALPFDGLEHEDSPWNSIPDNALAKKDELEQLGWPLLAHEQSHSWDGKYRRPGELDSKPDYQGPERTSLLWVYEGGNEYIGDLLATRAGFNDAATMRDVIANQAARYSHQTARTTTALIDTADASWVLRGVPGGWYALRRGQDYYDEGMLAWLGVDAIIRRQTAGRRSFDDFARAFFGQRDTGPIVVHYDRADVERTLAAIAPYDWHAYFQQRIYEVNPKPPTDTIEMAGWRLVYTAAPSKFHFFTTDRYDANNSLGFTTTRDGTISDVLPNSPADAAGLAPRMTILGVNGRVYSADVLADAIAHPPNQTITTVVRSYGAIETHTMHYAGGLRIPHLERIPGTPDLLTAILKPRPV